MSLLLCSLVHTIFISGLLVLQRSVFPNYIYMILGSLMGFCGSLCSGVTTNCSSVFIVWWYLVAPLFEILPFSVLSSSFYVNVRFRVISFVFLGYQFRFPGFPFPVVFPVRINTLPWNNRTFNCVVIHSSSLCVHRWCAILSCDLYRTYGPKCINKLYPCNLRYLC